MRFSCFVIPDLFSLTTYALTLCVSIFGSIMTVCKQPVATLALNATSIYVVMIREWGRDRLFKSSNYLYLPQMYGEEMLMKMFAKFVPFMLVTAMSVFTACGGDSGSNADSILKCEQR